MKNSPISKITLDGRSFFVKRDDLIDPYLAGNKYRKLYRLLNTPSNTFNKIVSYGGTQSNAMLAIAALCKEKGWEFVYYTKTISKRVESGFLGNFHQAIKLGMQHVALEDIVYKDMIASLRLNFEEGTFLVDQGGADSSAVEGLSVLAQEIKEQLDSSRDYSEIRAVATPSGTGTTALYLARSLPDYRVYTVPCVGDEIYLREQMQALEEIPSNLVILPTKKKYHFAKPYLEFYEIYKKLKSTGVEFDMLYAPSMWLSILDEVQEPLLYVHSGGVTGNPSMLERYQKKFSL